MLFQLCQAHHALPHSGGVMDQRVGLLRMHATLTMGGYFGASVPTSAMPNDPLADIPMAAL